MNPPHPSSVERPFPCRPLYTEASAVHIGTHRPHPYACPTLTAGQPKRLPTAAQFFWTLLLHPQCNGGTTNPSIHVRRIPSSNAGVSLTENKKKECSGFPKKPAGTPCAQPWLVAVGGWRLAAVGGWQLATGGWWRLVVVGGGWWLTVGGWRQLAVVGSWRLVAAGGWRRLVAVGGWRLVAVGS